MTVWQGPETPSSSLIAVSAALDGVFAPAPSVSNAPTASTVACAHVTAAFLFALAAWILAAFRSSAVLGRGELGLGLLQRSDLAGYFGLEVRLLPVRGN